MTSRTSTRPGAQRQRQPRGPAAPVSAGRPVSRLRTIDEAAELLNVSPRTVPASSSQVPSPCTGSGASFELQTQISRCSSPRVAASERWLLLSARGMICVRSLLPLTRCPQ
jgi:hypothetical protein